MKSTGEVDFVKAAREMIRVAGQESYTRSGVIYALLAIAKRMDVLISILKEEE